MARAPLTVITKEDFPGHLSILLGKGGGDEGPSANGRVGWKGDIRWEIISSRFLPKNSTMLDRGRVSVPRPAVGGDEVIE